PSPHTTVLCFSASSSASVSDPLDQGGSSSSTAMGTRPTSSPSTSRTSSWAVAEVAAHPWAASGEGADLVPVDQQDQLVVVVGVDRHPVDLVGEGVDLAGAAQGQGPIRAAP